jgi:SAM-dependent methyltransferase
VIFCDISVSLLEQCREVVGSRGLLDRARFVASRAEDLAAVADTSVDVVTTRAVLLFVTDKRAAFSAMHRVLRSGGRVSLREALGRVMFPEPQERLWGYDLRSIPELVAKVKAGFTALEDPAFRAAIMEFDDRDLARLPVDAGFERVHAECHIVTEPGPLIPAESAHALLQMAPNPTSPTLGEAVEASLTENERQRFLAELDRASSAGKATRRIAFVYVRADKGG